jgi:hypothetical protein
MSPWVRQDSDPTKLICAFYCPRLEHTDGWTNGHFHKSSARTRTSQKCWLHSLHLSFGFFTVTTSKTYVTLDHFKIIFKFNSTLLLLFMYSICLVSAPTKVILFFAAWNYCWPYRVRITGFLLFIPGVNSGSLLMLVLFLDLCTTWMWACNYGGKYSTVVDVRRYTLPSSSWSWR